MDNNAVGRELLKLFRRNFPYITQSDEGALEVLANPENVTFERRDADGALIAAAVTRNNVIYMLCVDAPFRRRGIGGALLNEVEQSMREKGCEKVVVGVGEGYLAPGIPTNRKQNPEELASEKLYDDLSDEGCAFFKKRGYAHGWDKGNCFDMRMTLADMPLDGCRVGDEIDGVACRWATAEDMQGVRDCVQDALPEFVEFYEHDSLYADGSSRALIAVTDGRVAGALIVDRDDETSLGSIGCTSVAHAYRGRRIAARLAQAGTRYLKDIGLENAYLSYTYSGLDRLYGSAGYQICVYFCMAEKAL